MNVTVVISCKRMCILYNNIASLTVIICIQVNSNFMQLPMNGHKSMASKIPALVKAIDGNLRSFFQLIASCNDLAGNGIFDNC